MNNLRLKGMSSNGTKDQCSDEEVQALGYAFFKAIDALEGYEGDEVRFTENELKELEASDLDHFELVVTKAYNGKENNWKGEFTCGHKNLTIYVQTSA